MPATRKQLMSVRVDVKHFRLPDEMAKSVRTIPESVGLKMAEAMRYGKGGVAEQFARQGAITRRGFQRWKPAKRVLRHGGYTLIDTGRYSAAWLNKGPGARTIVDQTGTAPGATRGPSVSIGVDSIRFPQARVFQRDRPTKIRARNGRVFEVAQRPIRINSSMVTSAKSPYVDLLEQQLEALGGMGTNLQSQGRTTGGVRGGRSGSGTRFLR